LGFFENGNKETYQTAIRNVKANGDKASKSDIELTKTAAKQVGSLGNSAREALNQK
jgi:hypothetical protein